MHQIKDSPRGGESPVKTSSTHTFHHQQHQQQQQQQPQQHQQTQQQAQPPGFLPHPSIPGGFSYATPYAAYAHPYATSQDIYRAAVPPPAHVVHAGMAGTPFYAGQFSAVPPHPPISYSYPPDYRPPYSSLYQPASAPTTFPPQGSYYLAAPATAEVPYQATSSSSMPTATTISSAASGTQLALPTAPHIPAAYYYSGYTYPYSAGRIIAPVLALGVLPFLFFSSF